MKAIPLLLAAVLFLGACTDQKALDEKEAQLAELQAPLDSLQLARSSDYGQIAPFMTFQKEDAETAMTFYMGLFENSEIVSLQRWGKDAPSKEGTIMHASFTLDGRLYRCSDSPAIHEWDFTPAVSNYVECTDEAQLKTLFTALSENGQVLMPLGNYGFSQQFGFVQDRFGVSWQLNLP